MPDQIEPVSYSQPRAVQIAAKYLKGGNPGDNTPHSAVHGAIAVSTNSLTETKAVLDGWDSIVAAAQTVAEQIITDANNAGGDNGEETPTGP